MTSHSDDSRHTDFLVDTPNPEALDRTLQSLGVVLIGGGMPGGYEQVDGHYVMRVLGDPGYVRFACESQGYCTIVREATDIGSSPVTEDQQ